MISTNEAEDVVVAAEQLQKARAIHRDDPTQEKAGHVSDASDILDAAISALRSGPVVATTSIHAVLDVAKAGEKWRDLRSRTCR